MRSSLTTMAQTFYQDEMSDHLTYKAVIGTRYNTKIQAQMTQIAQMELRHADFWKEMLEAHGASLPQVRVSRVRLCSLRLLRLFINPVLLVSLLELGETSSMQRYLRFYNQAELDEDEKGRLKRIILDELEHETFFKQTAQMLGAGNLRDFVLGMNDGLVEVLGAVAGLSAIYPGTPLIVGVSGLIVGIAGALSMGIGAFISVRSQRQVDDGLRRRMEVLFAIAPERAVQDYRGALVASGVPVGLADETAQTLGKNKRALANLILPNREEVNELRSGLYTGAAYLVGMVFPVLPYFFASSALMALPASIVLAGLSLTLVGSVIALLSGISIRQKIGEMVISGFAAAGLSYGFGVAMRALFGIGAEG